MIFLRKDFSNTELCIFVNILKGTAYFTIPVLHFAIFTLVLVVNYVATIIILQKNDQWKEASYQYNKYQGNGSQF